MTATYYGDQSQYGRLDIALDNGETLKIQDAFFGTKSPLSLPTATNWTWKYW